MIKTLGRRWAGSGAALTACFMIPTFFLDGCGSETQLETRTFELQYLAPPEAVEMVLPYVYPDRAGAPGIVTHFSSGITVRETPEALRRIREVLDVYDRPKPSVRLHFQVIEADGFTGRDERIADVQEALEKLFRFDGYRLIAEGQMAMMPGTSSRQALASGERSFELESSIVQVRGSGASGSAVISVFLRSNQCCQGPIQTSVAVPVGETVVLGSSQSVDQPTLILTVRPEFVELPDSTGS